MRFKVMGVDDAGLTELFESDSLYDATSFFGDYIEDQDAGGWDMIEVYDTDYAEDRGRIVVLSWERNEVE